VKFPWPLGTLVPKTATQHTKTGQKASVKPDMKNLGNTTDPDYDDQPEIKNKRKGGVWLHLLLLDGSQMCKKVSSALKPGESEDTILVRCIGSKGCGQTWAMPWSKQHIVGHLVKCGFVDAQLRQHARDLLASQAIRPEIKLTDMKTSNQASHVIEEDASCSESEAGMVQMGKKGGKLTAFISKEKKQAKEKCDYHIMKFVVCSGIPPTVADSNKWKEVINVLHPFYQSPSSSTLSSTLIVNEAVKISLAIDKYLLSSCKLTITFDGGKI